MANLYDYDMYANNPANYIQNEIITLIPVENFDGQLGLVINGPFYIEDFQLTYTPVGGSPIILTEGKDFVFILPYVNGTLSTGLITQTGIVVYNLPASASLSVNYRTIGGTYIVDPSTLQHFLTTTSPYLLDQLQKNFGFDIYQTDLDDILAYLDGITTATCLPRPDYNTLTSDTITGSDLVTKINEISAEITNRAPIPYTQFHINDLNNPHVVTKQQIGLEKVPNLRLATNAEAQVGQPLNVMFTFTQLQSYISELGIFDYAVMPPPPAPTPAPAPTGYITHASPPYVTTFNPTMGIFYGGSETGPVYYNLVTRIDSNGNLVGTETSVGNAREGIAGAHAANYAIYYGGWGNNNTTSYNTVTIVDNTGSLVTAETNVGAARRFPGGANIGNNAVFYGGLIGDGTSNLLTAIDSTGALIGTEINIGSGRYSLGGISLSGRGLYKGGASGPVTIQATTYNTLTIIDDNNSLVGNETSVGLSSAAMGTSDANNIGLLYGGFTLNAIINNIAAIDPNGATVGTQYTTGTARDGLAGANTSNVGSFYGGFDSNVSNYNLLTKFNSSLSQIGSESNVGTGRHNIGGVGVE